MDYAKPLRQRGRKSALTCNVLFSLGGNTILRFPGNLCARMAGLGFKVTGAGPLLSCYAGCHLGHNETICGAEVFNASRSKRSRRSKLSNETINFYMVFTAQLGGVTEVRFLVNRVNEFTGWRLLRQGAYMSNQMTMLRI